MKIWNHQRRCSDGYSLKAFLAAMVALGLLPLTTNLRAQNNSNIPVAQPAPAAASDAPTSPVASSINSMSALNDQSKLGNGDRISYRVLEEQKDPIILMISDSGELEVPLVGRYAAAGKTCKQLAYELKPLLEKEYFYHATVILGLETLSTRSRGKVYLTGQVGHQGAVDIPPNENLTVSKAILLNGGLADFADRRRVKLVRKKPDGNTTTTVVDLVEILDKGHTSLDPVVQPDDVIVVPQRLINF